MIAPRGGGLGTLWWSAVLLAGVAASVVQLRDPAPAQPEADPHGHDHESARPKRLFAWEGEQAEALQLSAPGAAGRERRFERGREGRWQEPAARPGAPDFDPAAFLAMLSQARVDRELPAAPEALPGFGLAPPLLTLQLSGPQGAEMARLAVGTRTPDGYGRYVRAPQREGVLIIPHYQFAAALQALGLQDAGAPTSASAAAPAGRP